MSISCCVNGYERIRNVLQDPELEVMDPDPKLNLRFRVKILSNPNAVNCLGNHSKSE
jgi:hypothetical protein